MGNRLSQSNKGFTLVELCVTIVIFTILVSTAVFGLIQWQEFSTYRQQTENAEVVYMAARSKLVKLKANNALDELQISTKAENITNKVTSYGSKTVYSAKCNKADYATYSSTPNSLNSSTKLLFDLIEEFIYDKSLLDACISIEFNEDGTILAVYYSDRCDEFKYGSGQVNLTQRTTENLEDNMVGYYEAS
ncbi:MAG: type II secretion system GspH family protein [Lachnospiraceae bacterium]|nr:type II secretion system GspH family protein [Lachnospiraceae bacterium]